MPDDDEPTTLRTTPLRTEVLPGDRACVVRLSGELDADDAAAVRGVLAEQVLGGSGNLVVDLSELTFIDSAGLAALIAAHKGTKAAGTRLVLAGPSPAVRKVLAITGLGAVLASCATVEDALREVGAAG